MPTNRRSALKGALAALTITALAAAGSAPAALAQNTGQDAPQDLPTVRLGLLKFGTVNWEARTIQEEGLDEANGFRLEIVPYAGGDATMLALRGGEVDVTTGDWLDASRGRASGEDITFVPYSTAIGAVMAPCESGIETIDDLKGKSIGVAGGPLDKSWLMLQGLAARGGEDGTGGFDLVAEVEPVYGAPPLLAEKLRQGELDATLNYWHYNARLEADGYCRVTDAQIAAEELGASGPIPAVGYLFKQSWADANPALASGFVAASRGAKEVLAQSDEAWERLRPMMKADDDAAFRTLRERFVEGIPSTDYARSEADTKVIYDFLAEAGGEKLVGSANDMAPGTYWSGLGGS